MELQRSVKKGSVVWRALWRAWMFGRRVARVEGVEGRDKRSTARTESKYVYDRWTGEEEGE